MIKSSQSLRLHREFFKQQDSAGSPPPNAPATLVVVPAGGADIMMSQ